VNTAKACWIARRGPTITTTASATTTTHATNTVVESASSTSPPPPPPPPPVCRGNRLVEGDRDGDTDVGVGGMDAWRLGVGNADKEGVSVPEREPEADAEPDAGGAPVADAVMDGVLLADGGDSLGVGDADGVTEALGVSSLGGGCSFAARRPRSTEWPRHLSWPRTVAAPPGCPNATSSAWPLSESRGAKERAGGSISFPNAVAALPATAAHTTRHAHARARAPMDAMPPVRDFVAVA
jgi:hypothetical protein